MLSLLLSWLLPSRCAGCGATGPLWCAACTAGVLPLRDPRCARCGAPTALALPVCRECRGRRLAFAAAWAAVEHSGPGAVLVRRWKDAGLDLSAVAAALVLARRGPPEAACLCPVPGVGQRVRRRGVDGPRRLAERLGAAWDMPVRADLLRRVGGAPQRSLDAAARRRNLAGAFVAAAESPPSVVLVDDVYTTGATAHACARALLGAGARRVEVLTFARALRR